MRSQDLAAELLLAQDIRTPPVPIEDVARTLGAEVVFEALDTSVSGLLYRSADERVTIVVNESQNAARQRFTIAHELGHLLLHKGRPVIVDHFSRGRLNLRDETSSLATSREEIDANQFAASILMPADWVHHAVERKADLPPTRLVGALSEEFAVSKQAMELRLMNLGIRASV